MRLRIHLIATKSMTLAALTLIAAACGKAPSPDVTLNVRPEANKTLNASDAVRLQLASINESVPSKGLQVWLQKDFWLGRTIWVSLGIERASLTGAAMMVDGYHPAKLSRAGSYLVLTRDNTGLYGGSVLGPEIPLNAYPIVAESSSEILVDLSSPKTPYGLTLSNFNAGSYADTELQPRFEYVKSVQTSKNSLSFESVSTTKSPIPLFNPKQPNSAEAYTGQDPYLLSMTLRTDWVIPEDNTGFVKKVADAYSLGFFLTESRLVNNGTALQKMVQKIATNRPFVWEISSNTPELYRSAIEQGILGWNPSLGGEVLKVQYGQEMGSVTKPETSNLVWDDNPLIGFAFANWRSNPSTGEIVQAQVYLSGSMWAQGSQIVFQLRDLERQIRGASVDAAASAPGSLAQEKAHQTLAQARSQLRKLQQETRTLAKQTNAANQRIFVGLNSAMSAERARSNNYCMRTLELNQHLLTMNAIDADLDEALRDLDGQTEAERQPDLAVTEHEFPTHMPYPPEGMNAQTFAQYTIRGVVMHEIGHTLGLRHNFMGSLGKTTTSDGQEIQSASIMDYNDAVIDTQFSEPGSSDKAIVESVYQNKPIVEAFAYCTDEHAMLGLPTCAPHDFSANPIQGQHVAEESNLAIAQMFLFYGQTDIAISLIMRALSTNLQKISHIVFPADIATQFLQNPGFADTQVTAWRLLQSSLAMQDMGYPDFFVAIYRDILIGALSQSLTPDSATSAVAVDIVNFLKEVTVDSTQYAFATRKEAVMGLMRIQTIEARTALAQSYEMLLEKIANSITPNANDQEVLIAIKKILLDEGYFRTAN